MTLRKTLLWQQNVRILDAAVIDGSPSHLIVLDTEKIAAYRYQDNRWEAEQSLPIVHPHAWPRDARGRLILRRDHLLDAYLPGTLCQSSGGKPLTLTCRSSDDPWPLGSEQAGLNGFFASTRNYFTGALAPGIGKQTTTAPFYSATVLPREKYTLGLFAGVDGQIHILDGITDRSAGKLGWGSNLAAIRTPCGSGWQVLASRDGLGSSDTITAYEYPDREPIPASSSLWNLLAPSLNCGRSRRALAPSRFFEILRREFMKRIALLSLVISSLLFSSVGFAANRPHYGGNPANCDTKLAEFAGSAPANKLTHRKQSHATHLRHSDHNQRSRDCAAVARKLVGCRTGKPTLADQAANGCDVCRRFSSLDGCGREFVARLPIRKWKIFPNSDSIIIETDIPNPQLPSELALARNAIVKRSGTLLGTGPFTVAQWQPGKSLVLTAKENYWGAGHLSTPYRSHSDRINASKSYR